ncbi:YabP/YqfC family sporulation protein [Lachnospiraceae bacterium 62-35]
MANKLKTTAVSAMRLPRDVCMGEALISMEGRHSLVIENYRNILLYTENEIKIQARTLKLSIRGKGLSIVYYDKEEMKITGCISAVELDGP